MPDWGKIVEAAVPAAVGITGAILGNRKQGQAITLSEEQLKKAYEESKTAYKTASQQALDIGKWTYGQQANMLKYGFENALPALQSGFTDAAKYLNPYSSAGENAMNQANFLLYGKQPTQQSLPDFGGTPDIPKNPFGEMPLPTALGGEGATKAGPASGGNMLAAFNSLGDNAVKKSAAGGILGLGGGAASAAIPFMTTNPVGLGAAAVSSLVGPIVGHFTRRGREKEAASEAVNELSDWVWKDAAPMAKSGDISMDDFKSAVQQGWGAYAGWLDGALKDKTVAQRSKDSQLGYLNEGLQKEFGFTI